jgi:hypothetical protein
MKTCNLFSLAVICKDLGIIMVHLMNSLQSEGIYELDCNKLRELLVIYWQRNSLISGIDFYVVRDESQVEGYEIVLHLKDSPLVLMSVNFNLS